jgi:rhamnose utilization protein RhaD (predicted bifunctional aldolase and dehydrogenase)
MEKNLLELIKISRIVGKNSLLIQGGGGNTSVKTDDGKFMYIKASGTALKDMNTKTGWRRLKLESVLSIIKDKSIASLDVYRREIEVVSRLRSACDDRIKGHVRPSIESHLHAMLGKYVIHLHPAAVLAYTCAKGGKHRLQKLFKNEKYPPLWVPYADPGFMLARRVMRLVEDYQKQFGAKPAILFLEKHGLLISTQNASAALKLVQKVIKGCNNKLIQFKAVKSMPVNQQALNYTKRCIQQAVLKVTGQKPSIYYLFDRDIAAFSARAESKRLLSFGALTPDELLYANGPAMWINKCDLGKIAGKLSRQIKKGAKPAAAFLVEDVGLFIVGTKKMIPAVSQIVRNSFFIRTNANRIGGISFLNKRQQEFIYNWEADAFRKRIAEG